MRKISMLLTLTMLLASLAGCAGDDDDGPSPVGEWWAGDAMMVHFMENGTLTDGEGNSGTWSTDGGILTITIDEANEFNFAVDGDWMWIQMGDGCYALHPEGISDEEYDDRVSEQTPPSFC